MPLLDLIGGRHMGRGFRRTTKPLTGIFLLAKSTGKDLFGPSLVESLSAAYHLVHLTSVRK